MPVEILGDPPPPKLKPLLDTLKYAYLDEKKIYPVIISANLSEQEEERLLKTLKKHRAAIGYTTRKRPTNGAPVLPTNGASVRHY